MSRGLWACPYAVLTILVRISGSQGLRLSPIPQGTDRTRLPGDLPADSGPPCCPRPRLWHLGVLLPLLPGDTEPTSGREQASGHRFSKVLPRDSSLINSSPQNFVPGQVALNKTLTFCRSTDHLQNVWTGVTQRDRSL